MGRHHEVDEFWFQDENVHNAAGYRDVEVNDEDDGEGDPMIHHGLIAQRLNDGHVAIERYGDPGPETMQQMSRKKKKWPQSQEAEQSIAFLETACWSFT